jgi:hypothetical protein
MVATAKLNDIDPEAWLADGRCHIYKVKALSPEIRIGCIIDIID